MAASGAPCPPAATSAARRSATTGKSSLFGDPGGLADLKCPPGLALLNPVKEGLAVGSDQIDIAV